MKIPSWASPAIKGAVVGAAGWWIALTWGFGWVSAGTANGLAEQEAQQAVVAYATPACLARFEGQPGAVDAWKKLQATDYWSRADVVGKAGWVALPGQKLDSDMSDAIAKVCTQDIMALKELDGVKLTSSN